MGLVISREIVLEFGGDFTGSTEGQGARFVVTLRGQDVSARAAKR